jgi:hypothetical protein
MPSNKQSIGQTWLELEGMDANKPERIPAKAGASDEQILQHRRSLFQRARRHSWGWLRNSRPIRLGGDLREYGRDLLNFLLRGSLIRMGVPDGASEKQLRYATKHRVGSSGKGW